MKTILLIDQNLAFVFGLGHALDSAKYIAVPAKSVPDAALLVLQLDLKVDVLVINLGLRGVPDFISTMRRSQRELKVIGIVDDRDAVGDTEGVDEIHSKPEFFSENVKQEWLEYMDRLLANR